MNKTLKPGWRYKKINELGFVGRGKSKHRPRNDPSLYGGEHPFIQTGDVKAADLYISKYSQTYNEKGLAQSKLWQPETLLITIAANIAETSILKIKACFPDSIVGFIANYKEADVRFVKYYIDVIKLQIQSISRGTTQDNLSIDKLLSFHFLTPPIQTQRKIADILSAYNRLIENNTRRIKILEEMAQTLYCEWFVNFRFPGHEQTKLVDSELGLIPEDWEIKTFLEVADFVNGFAFKPHHWGNLGKPIVKIVELKNGVIGKTPFYDEQDIPSKHNIKNGDVLFSWSADLDTYIWANGEAFLNQHIFKVLPHDGYKNSFIFFSLKEHMQKFRNISQGTTMKHIKRSALNQVKLTVPLLEQSNLFEFNVEPMIQEILNLKSKNINLRCTRDLLLPKLIIGKIDVENLDIESETTAA